MLRLQKPAAGLRQDIQACTSSLPCYCCQNSWRSWFPNRAQVYTYNTYMQYAYAIADEFKGDENMNMCCGKIMYIAPV